MGDGNEESFILVHSEKNTVVHPYITTLTPQAIVDKQRQPVTHTHGQ